MTMRNIQATVLMMFVLMLSGCGYNAIQATDEQVKADWAEVLNQYQRRSDLIPNLVNTVKGASGFEQETLVAVVNARAKATGITVSPETVNDPDAFAKFEAAQSQLGSALSRLMVVVEKYPDLKSNTNYLDLQAQLEGTENRITVARNRYIKSVQSYNTLVRSFPNNLTAKMFGYTTKASFTVENEKAIATPPTVDFGNPAKAK